MIIINNVDEAVRYVVAPRGTLPQNLGERPVHLNREDAEAIAFPVGLAVFAVTVTVQQITRL